jgi:hypothetical protein
MPKKASRRIGKVKKVITKKAHSKQGQKEMVMASIAEVHVTLPKIWASR